MEHRRIGTIPTLDTRTEANETVDKKEKVHTNYRDFRSES